MSFGDLHLMIAVSSLNCGEKSLPLSARELDMMRLLMSNTSQYLSKEMLLSKVWGHIHRINQVDVPTLFKDDVDYGAFHAFPQSSRNFFIFDVNKRPSHNAI